MYRGVHLKNAFANDFFFALFASGLCFALGIRWAPRPGVVSHLAGGLRVSDFNIS